MVCICCFELQPVLQPFFPDWNNNLIIFEPVLKEGLYCFKISIGSVWRCISISGNLELDILSDAVLKAFDFDHDHLYQFTYRNRKGLIVNVNDPELEESPYADETLIGELGLKPGDSFVYLYDFGDQWEFSLKLDKISPLDIELSLPILLDSYGDSPVQYENDDEFDEF